MTAPVRATNAIRPLVPTRRRRVAFGVWLRRLVRPPMSFGGLAVGTAFFWASLTPSLLPRSSLFQGVVGGISALVGYGVGAALGAATRLLRARRRTDTFRSPLRRAAPWIVAAVALLGTVAMLWQAQRWQNQLRALMGMGPESTFSELGVVLLTMFVFGVGLLVALRSFGRVVVQTIDRFAPRAVSLPIGIVVAALLVAGFVQGVVARGAVALVNETSSVANRGTNESSHRPTSSERSGGPGSLVTWSSLGREGRAFVGEAPSLAELRAFDGPGCCAEPVRVYVGLDSPGSVRDHAQLAVREMERTHAFERAIVAVFVATGNGWINPKVADSLEYLYGGNTAEVSLQYSYLPSAMSFLVDQTKARDAAKDLVDAVLDHVDRMPSAHRPRVVVYGESLGSYGIERAFGSVGALRSHVDGALLVGPTFANPIWKRLTAEREQGSPQWLPRLPAQTGVSFARTPADLAGVTDSPAGARVVYLQNASDPVTWWNIELTYSRPPWTRAPRAPDRSPALRWFPFVTFLQTAADLANSLGVPAGHGHYFGGNVVDGWVAVAKPPGWTHAETERVRALVARLDESSG
jgi:uncharacterized membrane protein